MSDLDATLRDLRTWLDEAQRQIDLGNVAFGGDPVDPVSTDTDFLLSAQMNRGQDLSFDACFGANGYFKASASSDHSVPPSGWDQSDGRAFRAPLVKEWVLDGGEMVLDVAHPSTSSTNTWDIYIQSHAIETTGYIRVDALSPVTELSLWTLTDTEAVLHAYFDFSQGLYTDETTHIQSTFYFPITASDLALKITTEGGGICKLTLAGGADTIAPPTPPTPPALTLYYYPNGPVSVPTGVVVPHLEEAPDIRFNDPAVEPYNGVPYYDVPAHPTESIVAFPGGLYSTHGFLSFDDGATWSSCEAAPRPYYYNELWRFSPDWYGAHLASNEPKPFWEPWSGKLVLPGIKLHTMDPSVGTWQQVSTTLRVEDQDEYNWSSLLFDQGAGWNDYRFADPCLSSNGSERPIFYAFGWDEGYLGSPYGTGIWLTSYSQTSGNGFFVSPTDASFSSWEVVGRLRLEYNPYAFAGPMVSSIKKSSTGWYYVATNNTWLNQPRVYVSQTLGLWDNAYWETGDSSAPSEVIRERVGLHESNGLVWITAKQLGVRIEQDVDYYGATERGFSTSFGWWLENNEVLISSNDGILVRNAFPMPSNTKSESDRVELLAIGWDGTPVGSPGLLGTFNSPFTVPPAYYNPPNQWPSWTSDGDKLFNTRPSY